MNITELKQNETYISEMKKSDENLVKPLAKEISAYSSKVTRKRILLREKANMLDALKEDARERASYKQKMGIINLQNFMPLLAVPILALVIYVTIGSLFMSLAGVTGEKTWEGIRHAMNTDYKWVLIALSALSFFTFTINCFSYGFQKFYHEYYDTVTILRFIQITASIYTNHLYVVSLNDAYGSTNWHEPGCLIGWFTASILEILSFFGSQVFTLLVYRLYDIDTRSENKGILFKILYIVKFPLVKFINWLYSLCLRFSEDTTRKPNRLDLGNTSVYTDSDFSLDECEDEELYKDEPKEFEYLIPENIDLYEEILSQCAPDEWLTKDTFGISQKQWRQLREVWKRQRKVYTRGKKTYKMAV